MQSNYWELTVSHKRENGERGYQHYCRVHLPDYLTEEEVVERSVFLSNMIRTDASREWHFMLTHWQGVGRAVQLPNEPGR